MFRYNFKKPKIIKPDRIVQMNLNKYIINNNIQEKLVEYINYIKFPSAVSYTNLGQFLYDIEFIFFKPELDFHIVVSIAKCRKISNTGLLILYVVFRILCENNISKVKLFLSNKELLNLLEKRGFFALYNKYISGAIEYLNPNLIEIFEDNFFVFPQNLSLMDDDKKQELIDTLMKKIYVFYSERNMAHVMASIGICIGEILSNFWAHSTDNSETFILAEGNSHIFRLYTLDTGIGIISNLRKAYPEKNDKELLLSCINQGVSSKLKLDKINSCYHMGYGLYFISEIIRNNSGILNIWSEGYNLKLFNDKCSVTPCGFWKGTIFELSFSLNNIKGISTQKEV